MSTSEQASFTNPNSEPRWDESNSETFVDYGRYFVPAREQQIATICALLPNEAAPLVIWELCCGEGLLAAAILAQHPQSTVYGFDGSPTMLAQASSTLATYGSRFQSGLFDLADRSWRSTNEPVHAVVSSLAIHHLDGEQKQQLFHDIHALLAPGGILVIADIIATADARGQALAAAAWDAAVQARALELDGSTAPFDAFQQLHWNMFRYVDANDIDKPSTLVEQLEWLKAAGFQGVDVYWMQAGHAIFGGAKVV